MEWEEREAHEERLGNWNLVAAVEYNGNLDLNAVLEVLATVEGQRDAKPWYWLLRLEDGYAVARGGCDYTGWD